jgi:MarR family 2-MHQ and catechol resistance regulon transcriptional repressor
MDKLCDKKLIKRARCEHDRRVVYVKITDEGLDLLMDIDNNNNSLSFLENITEQEAIVLSNLLDKIR